VAWGIGLNRRLLLACITGCANTGPAGVMVGAVVRARGEWQLLGLEQIIRHSGMICIEKKRN